MKRYSLGFLMIAAVIIAAMFSTSPAVSQDSVGFPAVTEVNTWNSSIDSTDVVDGGLAQDDINFQNLAVQLLSYKRWIHRNMGDSTLTVANIKPGSLIYTDVTTGKKTYILPGAAVGIEYEMYASDTDSTRLTTATGDTLVRNGNKWKTLSVLKGQLRVVALDATYWAVVDSAGTITGY